MNFLYPGFLFALLSIAIPVIIHLFNFRRFKTIYFSNVRFLREVKERDSSRSRIKDWLLLCCRIFILLFLVLAFARPYLPANEEAVSVASKTISIYVDNSYSMEAVNQEGNLLDEAKRRARELVKAHSLNDRFQVLTNDFEGRHQRLLQGEEALSLIDEIRVSPASRTLAQVLQRQSQVLEGKLGTHAYLISDFQKGFAGHEPLKTDSLSRFTFVRLKVNPQPNVVVDSLWLASPITRPGEAVQLLVRLKNYGQSEAKQLPLTFTLNGQQKLVHSIDIAAGGMKIDTLSYRENASGYQKGEVRIQDFPLTFDDVLYFTYPVYERQQVLSIDGADASTAYIRALFHAEDYFQLKQMNEQQIDYTAIPRYSLVILNELSTPSSGLAHQLRNYVENGGSVLIFPNTGAEQSVYNAFLTQLNLPSIHTLQVGATAVKSIELKHPLWKDVFKDIPLRMDLPEVKRFFEFNMSSRQSREDLLLLPGQKPFLSRYALGHGRIYLAASGLSEKDNLLSKHPLYVPLMYKIAFESRIIPTLYGTTQQEEWLEIKDLDLPGNTQLRVLADQFEVVPEVRRQGGRTALFMADQIRKSGFYDLKNAEELLAVLAFNDNRTESVMSYDTEQELKSVIGTQKIDFIDPEKDSISSVVSAQNKGTELWKLCLILSIVFLAIEILIIRFYHTKNHSIT